jgi:hypothetical protein
LQPQLACCERSPSCSHNLLPVQGSSSCSHNLPSVPMSSLLSVPFGVKSMRSEGVGHPEVFNQCCTHLNNKHANDVKRSEGLYYPAILPDGWCCKYSKTGKRSGPFISTCDHRCCFHCTELCWYSSCFTMQNSAFDRLTKTVIRNMLRHASRRRSQGVRVERRRKKG